jgi:hypothetical protein
VLLGIVGVGRHRRGERTGAVRIGRGDSQHVAERIVRFARDVTEPVSDRSELAERVIGVVGVIAERVCDTGRAAEIVVCEAGDRRRQRADCGTRSADKT